MTDDIEPAQPTLAECEQVIERGLEPTAEERRALIALLTDLLATKEGIDRER